MSQLATDKVDVPVLGDPKAKTADDIFAELGKDDELDSLDLTKPIKPKDEKSKDKQEDKDKDKSASDDLEGDDKEDKEGKDKVDEEVDELALLEEDLEEIDEEKLELTTPVRRREILAKYPNLFKDFPYLEKAYYREQQFTEILSTIEDAKAAADSHRTLRAYSEDMIEKGNVKNVLKMIKDNNPETFAQVADSYLDHLYQVDQSAYTHVQSNMVKNIILGMVEEAKSSNDDDLRTAALLLNKWAFGSAKFTPPQKLAKEGKPEDKGKEEQLSQREKEFLQKQIDTATNEVTTKVSNSIKGAIEQNIDPNGSMTDYVKRNAVRDAIEKVSDLIKRDTRFQKIVSKLWEKAEKANFSPESQSEIRRAYLSKAKSLLAPVIKSARAEALKGMGRKPKVSDEGEEEQPTRERVSRDKEETTERRLSSDKSKAKLDSLRGKSTYEALNSLMGD